MKTIVASTVNIGKASFYVFRIWLHLLLKSNAKTNPQKKLEDISPEKKFIEKASRN